MDIQNKNHNVADFDGMILYEVWPRRTSETPRNSTPVHLPENFCWRRKIEVKIRVQGDAALCLGM
jgi:hypothetical protein